ncbi:HlyD family efflux transporter periplasmic adaptor subunit [Roseateles sp.]|uniref:HlyD family secretion protein n=1 Tax=Roseateles sp. TaxID=1971397 RepID=UPI0031D67613
MSLFRPEARRPDPTRRAQTLGLRVESDRQHLALTLLALGCIAVLIGSLFVWETKRRVKVVGRISPHGSTVRIVAQGAGIVVDGPPREGQAVRAGDSLLTLSAERTAAEGAADRSGLAALQRQMQLAERQIETTADAFALQRGQKTRQLRDRQAQGRQLAAQRAIEAERERLLAQTAGVNERLAAEGFISAVQRNQKQDEWLNQRSRVLQLDREASANESNALALQGEIELLGAQAQIERQRLEGELSAMRRQLGEMQLRLGTRLLAPISGTATAIQAAPGQAVGQGAALLALIPTNARLQAKALVPSAAMGFLRVGQQVQLSFLAFPSSKFGHQLGRVASFNAATVSSSDPATEDGRQRDPMYEVLIDLDRQTLDAYGQARRILPDMQFEAHIVTDSRTVFEWIFEPLFAMARR